jgi:hypothetical protein
VLASLDEHPPHDKALRASFYEYCAAVPTPWARFYTLTKYEKKHCINSHPRGHAIEVQVAILAAS